MFTPKAKPSKPRMPSHIERDTKSLLEAYVHIKAGVPPPLVDLSALPSYRQIKMEMARYKIGRLEYSDNLEERDHFVKKYVLQRMMDNLDQTYDDEKANAYKILLNSCKKYGLLPGEAARKLYPEKAEEYESMIDAAMRPYVRQNLAHIYSQAAIYAEDRAALEEYSNATAHQKMDALMRSADIEFISLVEDCGHEIDRLSHDLVKTLTPAEIFNAAVIDQNDRKPLLASPIQQGINERLGKLVAANSIHDKADAYSLMMSYMRQQKIKPIDYYNAFLGEDQQVIREIFTEGALAFVKSSLLRNPPVKEDMGIVRNPDNSSYQRIDALFRGKDNTLLNILEDAGLDVDQDLASMIMKYETNAVRGATQQTRPVTIQTLSYDAMPRTNFHL